MDTGALTVRELNGVQVVIDYAHNQAAGMAAAWQRTQPGDRLVIIADQVDGALAYVHRKSDGVAGVERHCLLPV
jgi:hypothetical protein